MNHLSDELQSAHSRIIVDINFAICELKDARNNFINYKLSDARLNILRAIREAASALEEMEHSFK
jgi:hypothetical protein